MTGWIEEIYRQRVGWELVETLTAIGGRQGGSPEEREAAGEVRDTLESVGCRSARVEPFDVQGWRRGESHVADGREHDCLALPYSPPGAVSGELVDLGHGLPGKFASADLDGTVVIVGSDVPPRHRFVHRREKYALAVEAGAAAFIFRNHFPGCLPRTGSVHGLKGPIGEIPAVGVSFEVGRRLVNRSANREIEVDIDAEVGKATSQNVHAELGPDSGARVILSAHLDGHDIAEGALDNAVGVGLVAEVGRALAAREDELDSPVELVAYGAEELGLVGSAHYARSVEPDSIKAIIQLDGAGRSRDLKLFTHGFGEFGQVAEAVGTQFDQPVVVTPEHYVSSDHWRFVSRGMPGALFHEPTGGGARNTILTPADTIDKLDPRDLREHAVYLTEFVVAIAHQSARIPHRTPGSVAKAVEREGLSALADQYEKTEQQ